MAAKKYYAVKKGRKTGIFRDWESCRASIEGYPGAEYKGFLRLEEGEAYLGGKALGSVAAPDGKALGSAAAPDGKASDSVAVLDGKDPGQGGTAGGKLEGEEGQLPRQGTLLAYVDGSYDHSLKKYAFGCVFILPDGRVKAQYGNGDNPQSLQQRNVAGEMLGAMYAVRTAMASGFSEVEIRYDYEGIEKWVTGAWRSKTELTRKYAVAMRQWGESVGIRFTKVAAHSNVYYNEMADKTAKAGLREAEGIPKVCPVEELQDAAE